MVLEKNLTNEQIMVAVDWEEKDFLYKKIILNGLTNWLYNEYNTMKTTKLVWDALKKIMKLRRLDKKKDVVNH